jgi:hypothetical protein
MPDQVVDLIVADAPMMGDAGDSAQRVVRVRPRGIHLADDRVLGADNTRKCGHRGADAVAPPAVADRIEGAGWVRQPQFGCLGE